MRLLLVLFTLSISVFAQEPRSVGTLPELLAAIADGKPGDRIQLAAGRYELRESLCPKSGMKLIGAGPGKTVLSHAPSWVPAVDSLPDPEMKTMGLDESAYLIRLPNKGQDIELAQMTLRGPKVHGAVFGFGNERLHIHHVHIEDVLWSGIRTFGMRHAKIHDCVFVDARRRHHRRRHLRHLDERLRGRAQPLHPNPVRQGEQLFRHQGASGETQPLPPQHHRGELLDGSRSTTTSATAPSRCPSTPAVRHRKADAPSVCTTTCSTAATPSSSFATASRSTTTCFCSTRPKTSAT